MTGLRAGRGEPSGSTAEGQEWWAVGGGGVHRPGWEAQLCHQHAAQSWASHCPSLKKLRVGGNETISKDSSSCDLTVTWQAPYGQVSASLVRAASSPGPKHRGPEKGGQMDGPMIKWGNS